MSAGSHGLAAVQARAASNITTRLATISTLEQGVTASTTLSADDKAALMTRLTASSDGLSALKDTIAGDTTGAAARADAQKVFTDYRVYRVLAPQVHGVERMSGMKEALAAYGQQLTADQAVLDGQPGGGTTDAAALLSGATSASASASSTLDSTITDLLSVTPAAYDADHTVLDHDRTAMETARTSVTTVGTDLGAFTDLHL